MFFNQQIMLKNYIKIFCIIIKRYSFNANRKIDIFLLEKDIAILLGFSLKDIIMRKNLMQDSIAEKAEVSSQKKDKLVGNCDSRNEEKRRIFGYKIKCSIRKMKSWRSKMFYILSTALKISNFICTPDESPKPKRREVNLLLCLLCNVFILLFI